jgi:hypothetical protein
MAYTLVREREPSFLWRNEVEPQLSHKARGLSSELLAKVERLLEPDLTTYENHCMKATGLPNPESWWSFFEIQCI